MELSTALLDGSDGLESDEEAPPVDSLLFEQAYQVCSIAIHHRSRVEPIIASVFERQSFGGSIKI